MQVVSGTAFPQNGSISPLNHKPAKSTKGSVDNGFQQIFDALTHVEEEAGDPRGETVQPPSGDGEGLRVDDGTSMDDGTADDKAETVVTEDESRDDESNEMISGAVVTGWVVDELDPRRPNMDELSREQLVALRSNSDSEIKQSLFASEEGRRSEERPGQRFLDPSSPTVEKASLGTVPKVDAPSMTEPIRTPTIFATEEPPLPSGEVALSSPEESDGGHRVLQRPQPTVDQVRGSTTRTDVPTDSVVKLGEEAVSSGERIEMTRQPVALQAQEDGAGGRDFIEVPPLAAEEIENELAATPAGERGAQTMSSAAGTVSTSTAQEGEEQTSFDGEEDGFFSEEEGSAPSMSLSSRKSTQRAEADPRPLRSRGEAVSPAPAGTEPELETPSREVRGTFGTGERSQFAFDADTSGESEKSTAGVKHVEGQDGPTNAGTKDSIGSPSPAPATERAETLRGAERANFTTTLAERLEEMVDTIVRERGPGGSEQVAITLHPEHLGRLVLRVRVDDAGVVHARFIADSAVVRAMIEQDLGQLRTALSEHGLSLGEAGVEADVGSHGDGQPGLFAQTDSDPSFAHRPNPENEGQFGATAATTTPVDEPDDVPGGPDGPEAVLSGIDIRV